MPGNEWREPSVVRLIARHRGKAPVEIVEQYARELLREWGVNGLPVDVDALASALGIRQRTAPFPFAGRVYVEPSGQLVMDLNADDGSTRRRFTCAHEIVHTLFPGFRRDFRYRLDTVTGQADRGRGDEEYLCDLGAASLLMPAELVRDRYSIEQGLSAIEELAADAEVSLEAAGNRLVEFAAPGTGFLVLEVRHKPADQTLLRRGQPVAPRLRVRYAKWSGSRVHVPRFKSADDDSVLVRALQTQTRARGKGSLPGVRERLFEIEAGCYPRGDGSGAYDRVLAVAKRG